MSLETALVPGASVSSTVVSPRAWPCFQAAPGPGCWAETVRSSCPFQCAQNAPDWLRKQRCGPSLEAGSWGRHSSHPSGPRMTAGGCWGGRASLLRMKSRCALLAWLPPGWRGGADGRTLAGSLTPCFLHFIVLTCRERQPDAHARIWPAEGDWRRVPAPQGDLRAAHGQG